MLNIAHISKYIFRFAPRPSFWEGVGALFDFRENRQKYDLAFTSTEADAEVLKADWQAVGDDLRRAMTTYERDTKRKGAHAHRRVEGG